MQLVKLELTVDETNFILGALSEGPFKIVAPLINKIQGQATTPVPVDKPMPTIEPAIDEPMLIIEPEVPHEL